MAISKKKSLQRRKPAQRKRLSQKNNERVQIGQVFNNSYNTGFAKGFEEGHQLAYEQQP